MVMSLMTAGERSAAHPSFRGAVYEAVSSLVTYSPMDCIPVVQKLTTAVVQSLEKTVQVQTTLVGSDEKRLHIEYQASLCSVLTVG